MTLTNKHITVIGAGPAGLGAASAAGSMGVKVTIYDKSNKAGGHLADWNELNPQMIDALQVINDLKESVDNANASIQLGCEVQKVIPAGKGFTIEMSDGSRIESDAVVYSGGYQVFDASLKEELGYGIYKRVVTSADLEQMLKGDFAFPLENEQLKQIGIVHCVGSRDAKVCRTYCSKMCCMVGVKQAIELKKRFPDARITNFYMDLRMFGNGYEDLYLSAQRDYGVQFLRGRVSEVSEKIDGSLLVKAEDTLMGKPVRGSFDLLVLLVGMEPAAGADVFGFQRNSHGFIEPLQSFNKAQFTATPGLFAAGACKGPSSVAESYADGKAAGLAAVSYLQSLV